MGIIQVKIRLPKPNVPLREMGKVYSSHRAARRIANVHRPLRGKRLHKWVMWRRRHRYWRARVCVEIDRRFGPCAT